MTTVIVFIISKFTEPIVEALNKLGVNAELSGRNDIQVGQAKISGNAMVKLKIVCSVMVL